MPRTLAVAVVCTLLFGAPAAAGQMDPMAPPQADGPISLANESYEGDHCTRVRYRNAVVSRTCRFFYRFDPAAETDAENDHGIWWFQASFRPRDGWCLKAAETTVTMPTGFVATAWTQKDRRVRRKLVNTTATLISNAGGNSTETARVRQSFVLRKGRYVNRWNKDGSLMQMSWNGRMTRLRVAFAGGFAGSWPAAEVPQPYVIAEGPTYTRC